MATRKDIKTIQYANGAGFLSGHQYYLCSNGIVLKTDPMSRLMVNGLRKIVAKEMEGERPKPRVEVIDMPGPLHGTEEIMDRDPDYLAAVDRFERKVDRITEDRWQSYIVDRGVTDIGLVPQEIAGEFYSLSVEEIDEHFVSWPQWREEAKIYKEKFSDLFEDDDTTTDKVIFVSYMCHDTQADILHLYNSILNSRPVNEILQDFLSRDAGKTVGKT